MIKDIDEGTIITPSVWCIYTEEKEEDTTTILAIYDTDKNVVYATQSETFRKNFLDIVEIFDDEEFKIEKLDGETKSGRPFVNCALAM